MAIKKLKHFVIIIIHLSMLLACSEPEKAELEFRIAEEKPAPDLTEMIFEPTGDIFYLHSKVLLNQYDVKSAAVVMQKEPPAVEIILTSDGAKKFKKLTAKNIGKRCGMVLNGKLLSAPFIRDTIPGGRAIINGIFTVEEAESIAKELTSIHE